MARFGDAEPNQSLATLTVMANIAFGAAAAMAIGAGVLWFTGAPETQARHIAVVPSFAPGGAGVVMFGQF